MGDFLRIFRLGSFLLWLDLGLIHSIVGIVVAIVVFAFLASVTLAYLYAFRAVRVGKSFDRFHAGVLKVLGTILLVLSKGSVLIFLEILLSPILCFTASDKYMGCQSTALSSWYTMIIGLVISLALIFYVAAASTFSTRECFLKTNYLSSATPSCELLDLVVRISSLLCAMFVSNMLRPTVGAVSLSLRRYSSFSRCQEQPHSARTLVT